MSGEQVSFTVKKLVVGEEYQFAAQAYNQFGRSEFSDRSDIVTITEGKMCMFKHVGGDEHHL